MGVVSPYGIGTELFWEKLLAGTDGLTELSRFPLENYRIKVGGQFRGNLTDLLIGRIFQEGAGDLFADMEPALAKAQSSPETPAKDAPEVRSTT